MIAELYDVHKKFGKKSIINGISFQVNKGRTFALLGPNGAGKTTSIRLLTGLYKPYSGIIKVFDQELFDNFDSDIRKKIGVQNDGSLYENLSVFENLNIWGSLYEMEKKRKLARIDELLEFFDLGQKKTAAVSTLSKGMKQKVLLARAILSEPEFLILDEPTSGLDPEANEKFTKLLMSLVKNNGTSIFLCTHQLYGLENLIDDVAIIRKGSIVSTGSVDELIKSNWPLVEMLIQLSPIVEARKILDKMQLSYNIEDGKIHLFCKTMDEVPFVIRSLSNADVDIYAVEEIKHSVKELYFKTMEMGEKNV